MMMMMMTMMMMLMKSQKKKTEENKQRIQSWTSILITYVRLNETNINNINNNNTTLINLAVSFNIDYHSMNLCYLICI